MQNIRNLQQAIQSGEYRQMFSKLYPAMQDDAAVQQRYLETVALFAQTFPDQEQIAIYSAPGRSEVGGNHTDHQHGCVLAAAVDLDIIGVVARNQDNVIRLQSKGYPMNEVALSDLSIQESEKGHSNALIRGIAAKFSELGYSITGLDIYTVSNVLKGSGLSSSAAFETLLGTILSQEFCDGAVDAVEIAKIGKFAENEYFGKTSGLMDQMVSSVGSFVAIDFADPDRPIIEKIPFDFKKSGYSLCITDTKGNHADLTPDYDAVPAEMKSVAQAMGQAVLRDVDAKAFHAQIAQLRGTVSDRAILRAIHFFQDNTLAQKEAEALKAGDFAAFLEMVRNSGNSSFKFLQNVYSSAHPEEQGVSLGLAVSEQVLQKQGACRVHGGGFAGTIQAFVPNELVAQYRQKMEELFGSDSCYILHIRELGGTKVTE